MHKQESKIAKKEFSQKKKISKKGNIKTLNKLYFKCLVKNRGFYLFLATIMIFSIIIIALPKFMGIKNLITASLIVISLNSFVSLIVITFFVYVFFSYQREHGFDLMVKSWIKDDQRIIKLKSILVGLYSGFILTFYLSFNFSISFTIYEDKINILFLYSSILIVLPFFIVVFGLFIMMMAMHFNKLKFISFASLFSLILLGFSISPIFLRNSTNSAYSKSKYSTNYVKAININNNKSTIYEVRDSGNQPMHISSNNMFTNLYPLSFLTMPSELIFGASRMGKETNKEIIDKSDRFSSISLKIVHSNKLIKIDELLSLDTNSIFELHDSEKEDLLFSKITDAFSTISDLESSRIIMSTRLDNSSVVNAYPKIFGATKSTFAIHELLEKQNYIKNTTINSLKTKLKNKLNFQKYSLFKYLIENYNVLTSIKLEIKKNISEFVPIKSVFNPMENIISNDLDGMYKMIKFENNGFVVNGISVSTDELNTKLKTKIGTKNTINNVNEWKEYIASHNTLGEARSIVKSLQKINPSIHFIFSENSLSSMNKTYPFKIVNQTIYKGSLPLLILLIFGSFGSKALINRKIRKGFLNKRK